MLGQGKVCRSPPAALLTGSPEGNPEIHPRHKRRLGRVDMLHSRVHLLQHLAKLIRAAAAAAASAACLLLLLLLCRRRRGLGIAIIPLCCRPLLSFLPFELSPKLPVPKVGWQAALGQELNGAGDAVIQVCRQPGRTGNKGRGGAECRQAGRNKAGVGSEGSACMRIKKSGPCPRCTHASTRSHIPPPELRSPQKRRVGRWPPRAPASSASASAASMNSCASCTPP